jgi:tetratricopeptide (TPR) repeat protein
VGARIGRHLAIDPSGRWAASALSDGDILLTDLSDGREAFRLPAGPVEAWCIAWAPDGSRLAVGRPDGGVDLWDLSQVGARLAEFGLDPPRFGAPARRRPAWLDLPPSTRAAIRSFVPPRSDLRRAADPPYWALRGKAAAIRGDWAAALSHFRRALALDPSNTLYWLQAAPLALQAGGDATHRALARSMLERFADTDDTMTAERTAKAGLLAPPPPDDLDRLSALAERATRSATDATLASWAALAHGMADLRAGRYEQAAARLRDALESNPPQGCRIALLPYLALAEHHLGHPDDARRHLDAANRELGRRYDPDSVYAWHDWLIADLARREAEALIGQTSP